MNQNELFNYDFSSIGDIFDRCDILKKQLLNTDEQEPAYNLIDDIIGWYKGLKNEWTPQMTSKQKEVMAKKYHEFENVANGKKKYFKRKANKGKFDDEELDEFNSSCIEYINECTSIRQWLGWFEDKMNGMFGEEWLYGKNSSQAVDSYSKCMLEAKKHFKVYEFAPRPEVSLAEFQTYFPQWMKDARQFKPGNKQAQYEYFCERAVGKLQETFGRNFTSYNKDYFKSATAAMELAKFRAAQEFLSEKEIEQMYPQPEKMFDTYEECKDDFVELICRICRTNKVDTEDRLNKLIRFCMHYSKYRYYSENETYIQYASDLYETAYKEGKKIVESHTQSLPF